MILKCKNGGVIKLQFAGNIPSIGLQQMVEAANSGDTEKAEALKNQFQLNQAKKIYADNKGEELKTLDYYPSSGYITQGRDKLYKNAYDRWTTNTAKGQEFKRFVNKPLSYAVENGLMVATGLGTLSKLNMATKGIQTVSKVAPLAEDLAYGLGTSYFATKGLQGLKEDIWGKRKFNPINTTLDVAMLAPIATAAKPIYNGIQNSLKSGNMWMRALRGEPRSVRRIKRLFDTDAAWDDKREMLNRMENSIRERNYAYDNAQRDIDGLHRYIDYDLDKKGFLTDFGTTWGESVRVPSHSYKPTTETVVFENPITGKSTTGQLIGIAEQPETYIKTSIPAKSDRLDMYMKESGVRYSPIEINISGNSSRIMKNDEALTSAIREYRDMINAKGNGKAVAGGSVHSISEGLHSGKPNDLELYTSPNNLDDVLHEFKINITNRSPRRIKGTSPYAINGEVDVHTLDPNGPDLEELGSLVNPEEHASKRLQGVVDSFVPFKSDLSELKKIKATPEEIETYFQRLRDEPGLLTQLMRKNNLQGIGTTDVAQVKFANRQREMGLQLPLEDLDVTLSQIESQIPNFVTFEKAYPNFDYTNIEGNKAFLRYFNLPESYATDFERMKRLYRQQHTQFTPSLREFSGPKSLLEVQKMARKNAQFNGYDASGGGGNMLISSNGGGRGGTMLYNTAAQYLPTYHPETILNGQDYVNAIERTKLFDRKITPEEDKALSQLLGLDYNIEGGNLSDIIQRIGRNDLENPEINPTIQEISKIIDVPRMTGVRYGGTNAVYAGNLSGEPISETFSLGKPFEFGRSFNEVLAPPRDGGFFHWFRDTHDLNSLPLDQMSSSDIDKLKETIDIWKDITTGGRKALVDRGYRYIESKPEANSEIERLKKVIKPGIDYNDMYNRANKISTSINKKYQLKQTLDGVGLGLGISLPVSVLGAGFYNWINSMQHQQDLGRYPNYYKFADTYFRDAYEKSPDFFPYDPYLNKYPAYGTKEWKNLDKQGDDAWKKWYKKNKRAIKADYKARKHIRKEIRKEEKEYYKSLNEE